MNYNKTTSNSNQKVINWDDFKVWLKLKLPELQGDKVIDTIEPIYNRLIDKIKSGKITVYTVSGKYPKINGKEYILTKDDLDLFMQGTFLKAQDLLDVIEELNADEKGEIVRKYEENRRNDNE